MATPHKDSSEDKLLQGFGKVDLFMGGDVKPQRAQRIQEVDEVD